MRLFQTTTAVRAGSFVTFCIVQLIVLHPVSADNKTEAKKAFESGIQFQKSGDFAAAVSEFEKSASAYPNQNNLYNLANCYRALGRSTDAYRTFARILADFKDGLDKEMVNDIEIQKKEIAHTIALLDIATKPEGATVTVDGKEVGVSPMTHALLPTPSKHIVEISLDGYRPITKSIHLEPGDNKILTFSLQVLGSSLSVDVNEAGTLVLLDDRVLGNSPLTAPISLETGTHTIKATKKGFNPAEQSFTAVPGQSQSIEIFLSPSDKSAVVMNHRSEGDDSRGTVRSRLDLSLMIAGTAGALIAGSVACASWAMTAEKKDDFIRHNNLLKSEYNDSLQKMADDDRSAVSSLNNAAVALTVVTGVFAGVAVAGAVFRHAHRKKEAPRPLSISPVIGGVQLRF